ncbi:MAG TPA: TIGR02996 domain-containing protein [Deltaproteobacteria bacterium]|nr:TIGR02996 domain-containing protein [Deltaproteobacteria bacterium]
MIPDALFEAICAAPDDDEPRAVLADHLIQRGDPRGTFIALQLRRAREGGWASKPERQLLKRHGHRWCGALAPVLSPRGLRFERGFLHTARVRGRWDRRDLAVLTDAVGRGEWRTLHALTCPRQIPDDEEVHEAALALLTHPVLGGLRVLHGLSAPLAGALQRSDPPACLEAIGLHEVQAGGAPGLGADSLPGVRRLALTGDVHLHDLGWLWDCPLWPRLEGITVMSRFYDDTRREAAYLDALASHAANALQRIDLVASCRHPAQPQGWTLRFTRDTQGRFTQLTAIPSTTSGTRDRACSALLRALEVLDPNAISALSIVRGPGFRPTRDQVEQITTACGRFGLQHLEV